MGHVSSASAHYRCWRLPFPRRRGCREAGRRPAPRLVELNGAVRIGAKADIRPAIDVPAQGRHERGAARPHQVGWDLPDQAGGPRQGCDLRHAQPARPFNSYSNCKRFAAGVHRLDFYCPPGSIRVEIPLFRRRATHWASVRVESAKATAGRSFKPANGFRGDYFAADFGIYVITVTDPAHETLLASWPVTLSADQPVVGVKLAIRQLPERAFGADSAPGGSLNGSTGMRS